VKLSLYLLHCYISKY